MPPTIIYLQNSIDDNGIWYNDTTWCVDQINDDDIQYIIASKYKSVVAENARLREELNKWYEYTMYSRSE